jgi:hypothetical protein
MNLIKQMEQLNQRTKAYAFVRDTIKGCVTPAHLITADRLISNYSNLYGYAGALKVLHTVKGLTINIIRLTNN